MEDFDFSKKIGGSSNDRRRSIDEDSKHRLSKSAKLRSSPRMSLRATPTKEILLSSGGIKMERKKQKLKPEEEVEPTSTINFLEVDENLAIFQYLLDETPHDVPLPKENKKLLHFLKAKKKREKTEEADQSRKEVFDLADAVFKALLGHNIDSPSCYDVASRPVLEWYFRAHLVMKKSKLTECEPKFKTSFFETMDVLHLPIKVEQECVSLLAEMDPTEVEKQKRNFDTKQKLFKAVIGIKREQEDEDIPDKLPSPILNTKGGEGGGGDRGGKKLSLQMTNSSGSMSAVSHNHMSFDVDYLFVLSFAYIYRFAVQNRFMEPNCVSSFSSLLGLVPAACRDSLKVETANALSTAEYVSSYRLLLGALHTMCNEEKTKLPAKFHRLSETQKVVMEQLNASISNKGEGLGKAVSCPRGFSQQQQYEWFIAHFLLIFRLIDQLYQIVRSSCTPLSCPDMSCSPTIAYKWVTENKKKQSVSAPSYINNYKRWVLETLLDSEKFPSMGGFKKGAMSAVKGMLKRGVRVLAHLYHEHMGDFQSASTKKKRRSRRVRKSNMNFDFASMSPSPPSSPTFSSSTPSSVPASPYSAPSSWGSSSPTPSWGSSSPRSPSSRPPANVNSSPIAGPFTSSLSFSRRRLREPLIGRHIGSISPTSPLAPATVLPPMNEIGKDGKKGEIKEKENTEEKEKKEKVKKEKSEEQKDKEKGENGREEKKKVTLQNSRARNRPPGSPKGKQVVHSAISRTSPSSISPPSYLSPASPYSSSTSPSFSPSSPPSPFTPSPLSSPSPFSASPTPSSSLPSSSSLRVLSSLQHSGDLEARKGSSMTLDKKFTLPVRKWSNPERAREEQEKREGQIEENTRARSNSGSVVSLGRNAQSPSLTKQSALLTSDDCSPSLTPPRNVILEGKHDQEAVCCFCEEQIATHFCQSCKDLSPFSSSILPPSLSLSVSIFPFYYCEECIGMAHGIGKRKFHIYAPFSQQRENEDEDEEEDEDDMYFLGNAKEREKSGREEEEEEYPKIQEKRSELVGSDSVFFGERENQEEAVMYSLHEDKREEEENEEEEKAVMYSLHEVKGDIEEEEVMYSVQGLEGEEIQEEKGGEETEEEEVMYSLQGGDEGDNDEGVMYSVQGVETVEERVMYTVQGMGGVEKEEEGVMYSLQNEGKEEKSVEEGVMYSIQGGEGNEEVGEEQYRRTLYGVHSYGLDDSPANKKTEPEKEKKNKVQRKLTRARRKTEANKIQGFLLEDTLSDQENEREDREVMKGWNERYQTICDQMTIVEKEADKSNIPQYEAARTFQEILSQKQDLYSLSQDFIHTAKTYGRIIIMERYNSQKTIPVASLGGRAGGEKYIVNGVLFKFAVDSEGLYANDDTSAAKVAGQELRGLMAYSSLGMNEICVPLMAVVDFMGFRVTAMSLLPISSDTIIYGTCDAGKHVFGSNSQFNEVMKKAGKMLNLKPHFVGGRNNRKFLFSAGDLEGHLGKDDRFYLLDFARTFPPSAPNPSIHAGHLFQLFRPEFVKNHPIPLCSDAFSGFIQADPKRKEYNEQVIAATSHLLSRVIPALVKSLERTTPPTKDGYTFLASRLCEEFHKMGVNLRYLGHAMMHTNDQGVFEVMMVEAIARVLKNDLKRRLRKKMLALKVPVLGPYKSLVVSFMNRIFTTRLSDETNTILQGKTLKEAVAVFEALKGIPPSSSCVSLSSSPHSPCLASSTLTEVEESLSLANTSPSLSSSSVSPPGSPTEQEKDQEIKIELNEVLSIYLLATGESDSNTFWNRIVTTHLKRNFGVKQEHAIISSIILARKMAFTAKYGRCLLFSRLQEITGCRFFETSMNKLMEPDVCKHPFDISSLMDFDVRVKHTSGVTNAEGSLYYMKGLELIQELSFGEALTMLKKTKEIFENSLRSSPNNKEALVQLSRSCRRILELEKLLQQEKLEEYKDLDKKLEFLFSSFTFSPSAIVEQTLRHLKRSVEVDESDDTLSFFYGCFLIQCTRFADAATVLLKCVQQNPDRVEYLTIFGLLLAHIGRANAAKQFLYRSQFIMACQSILQDCQFTLKLSQGFGMGRGAKSLAVATRRTARG